MSSAPIIRGEVESPCYEHTLPRNMPKQTFRSSVYRYSRTSWHRPPMGIDHRTGQYDDDDDGCWLVVVIMMSSTSIVRWTGVRDGG